MADKPITWLFNAAKNKNETEKEFKAKLKRATDAQVNCRGSGNSTVFIELAYYHDWPELVGEVIKRSKVDVHFEKHDGMNAMQATCYRNHIKTAKYLFKNFDAWDGLWCTSELHGSSALAEGLDVCRRNGYKELEKLFLEGWKKSDEMRNLRGRR